MSYSTFQNQVSSEKLTLAVLQASNRLMGWTLDSGSIYKLTNFDVQVIVSLEDSGNSYTEVSDLASVTASKFYNDRENKILYLRTTGSDNPNGRFLVLTRNLFFSTDPVVLPHDLADGTPVYWEPMIETTSGFTVEIDTINQTSEAIEGSGSLTLNNDHQFWPAHFEKLTFENRLCLIYSYNRNIEASEAKILFKGMVEKKTYQRGKIQFKLKDLLVQLQSSVALANIEELGLRNSEDLNEAKQRMILGRVKGHRPVNLDEELEGYPLTGTISIDIGSATLTGVGTSFLAELSPDDTLIIEGVEFQVATISSNTSLTLSEEYLADEDAVSVNVTFLSKFPKRFNNRVWLVAGHALREPTTTIVSGSSITRMRVASTQDIYDGDLIYVGDLGSGEMVQIDQVVNDNILVLANSLVTIPTPGTNVFKPAIQNLRIDDVLLRYERDYSFNATTGILTLTDDAEKNAGPLRQMPNTLTFTNASRTVTGTNLSALLNPGNLISVVGQADFFEVLSVDSATQATLRTPSTFSATATGKYKNFVFDPKLSVMTCDAFGRTLDGTPTGELVETAPGIVKLLLSDLGLSSSIDSDSFDDAEDLASQPIGFVIPQEFEETDVPTYRDVFNNINKSVFGSLVQSNSFELKYIVLHPDKSSNSVHLDEADILEFTVESVSDKLVKTAIVEYSPKEYDYLTATDSIRTQQNTSEVATHLLKLNRQRTFETYLVNEVDADRHAKRWSFILEYATTKLKFKTKLQGVRLEVGSIIDLTHRKFYDRLGSGSKRKLALVEVVKKNGNSVEIEAVDLGNAFNRIASINEITTTWAESDEDSRIYGGFITDEYGLIDNDPESSGLNLIW